MRNHTSHHLEQTLARASEMVRTFGGLRVHPFPQVLQNLQLITVEVTGDANALTSHHHDTLFAQDLFRDDRSKTAHEVAGSIDDHNLFETHFVVGGRTMF